MHQNSTLICSGIIEHRFDDVKNALVSNGYNILNYSCQSEWYEIEARI